MDSGLEGKVALVAGAGRGIGRACTLALAAGGVAVGCVDPDHDRGHAVAEEIKAAGGRALTIEADVLDRGAGPEGVRRSPWMSSDASMSVLTSWERAASSRS